MKAFLLLFLSIISYNSIAQNASVRGTVTGPEGAPLPFANVFLKGTNIGTSTNNEGSFFLNNINPEKYTLVVSAVGYTTIQKEIILTSGKELIIPVQLSQDNQNLNEIVITSNRRTETLDEVPSSVSVLTASQIENRIQTSNNIADVLIEIPGIALSTNQTSNVGQTLRGRNMLVLIDGIPQSTPLRSGGRDINTIDPNSLERIEVIKGATAIYGNGADGGIINYITKKPEMGKRFESTTQLGAEGSLVDIDHTVGAKLSQTFSGNLEKLSYLASGSFRQTGIFRDANGEVVSPTYGLGETNQYNFLGKLNYRLTEDYSLETMYNYYSSNQDTEYINQNGIYGETPAIGVIGEVLGVDQGNRFNHNAQMTYDANNLIGNTDLRLNLYLQDFKTVYGFSDFFFNPEAGYVGGQSTIESTKTGARFNFRTPYSFGGDINGDILYGIDILNDKTSQNLIDGRVWAPEMDMVNFAPYAQLKTIYNDFVLKAGIRFENINIEVPDYETILIYPTGPGAPNGGVAVNGGELKYDATTFNTGLRYNRYEIFQPFVSFSQSFSIADLGRTLRTATENTVSQINSEAVIANNYEAGFNSRLGRTRLSGAYFVSTSELGATYREVNGVFQIARQPEKVYGFELALDTEIIDNVYFGSSVSYTEGKLDSESSGEYDTYINGDRIPPLKLVNYLQYDLNNKWDARISHIYSGNRERFEPAENGSYVYGKGPVESFNLINFTSNYQLTPNTELGLGIENLLNEDYYNLLSQWSARDSNYIKGNGTRFSLTVTVNL